MRKIPNSMQKVFNFARSQGRVNVYKIAKDLDLDYKNVHVAVKRCEELGLLSCVMERSNNRLVKIVFPRPEIIGLRIESVFLEAGSRLLKQKESRRKAYFEMHGSMSLPKGVPQSREPVLGAIASKSVKPKALKKSIADVESKPLSKPLPSASLRKKAFVV